MGWLWTYFLQQAGVPTLLLHRDTNVRLRCEIHEGKTQMVCRTPAVNARAASLPNLQALLVATKAFSVRGALLPLEPQLRAQGIPLILAQNGLGIFEEVRELLPDQPIALLSTSNAAFLQAPGQLRLTGRGPSFLGHLDDSISQEQHQQLLRTLQTSGLTVHAEESVLPRLWEKLLINCCINSLTALWLCKNGELLNHPAALALWFQILTEGQAVMQQELGSAPAVADLLQRVQEVAEKTSANYSSMCEDRRHHRPTEVAYIQGYIVRRAEHHRLPVPTLQTLAQLLHFPDER